MQNAAHIQTAKPRTQVAVDTPGLYGAQVKKYPEDSLCNTRWMHPIYGF